MRVAESPTSGEPGYKTLAHLSSFLTLHISPRSLFRHFIHFPRCRSQYELPLSHKRRITMASKDIKADQYDNILNSKQPRDH